MEKSHLSPRPPYRRTDTSSTTDTTSSLSSRSPSILDLGHRSVVRQRLAAMRNGQPPPSTSSPTYAGTPTRTQNFNGRGDGGSLSPSWKSRSRSQSKEYSDTGTALTTPATSRAPSECGSATMNKPRLSGVTLAVQDLGSSLKQRSYCASEEIIIDYMDAPHGDLDDEENNADHSLEPAGSSSRLTTPAQSIIDYYSDEPTSPIFDPSAQAQPSTRSAIVGSQDDRNRLDAGTGAAIHSNIQDLASGLDLLLKDSEHQTSDLSSLRGATATLNSQLTSLHTRTDDAHNNLLTQGEQNGAKVNEVRSVVEGLKAMIEEGRDGGMEDTKELKGMVEEVRSRLKELPVLLGVAEAEDGKEIVTMGNLSPFRRGKEKELPAEPGRAGGGGLDQEQVRSSHS